MWRSELCPKEWLSLVCAEWLVDHMCVVFLCSYLLLSVQDVHWLNQRLSGLRGWCSVHISRVRGPFITMGLSWDLPSGSTGLDLSFLHFCSFGWTEEMDELTLLRGVFLTVVWAESVQCQGCFHKGASPFFCQEDVISCIYYIGKTNKKKR